MPVFEQPVRPPSCKPRKSCPKGILVAMPRKACLKAFHLQKQRNSRKEQQQTSVKKNGLVIPNTFFLGGGTCSFFAVCFPPGLLCFSDRPLVLADLSQELSPGIGCHYVPYIQTPKSSVFTVPYLRTLTTVWSPRISQV